MNRKIKCDYCDGLKDYRAKRCNQCRAKILKERPECNSNYKHGHTGEKISKTYWVWSSMVQRCENKNNKAYNDYGKRGIRVCKKWLIYENFLKDMGEKPKGFCIDRINNDKGYYKENCRWVDRYVSNDNRREIFKNKTSKFKGVYFHKKYKKWAISLTYLNKTYNGKMYDDENEAKAAYLKLRNEVRGDK